MTAHDDAGRTITAQATVTVTNPPPPNQPPVAQLVTSPATPVAPATITLNAAGSTDADGTITDYAFSFGDGTANVHGTSASISHVYNNSGDYYPSVTVTDNAGAKNTFYASVHVDGPLITKIKGTFTVQPGTSGTGTLNVAFNIKRTKTGTYGGTVTYNDVKAAKRAKCTVVSNGVQRSFATSSATITTTCAGLGVQKGLTGNGQFQIYDNTPYGVVDFLTFSVGGNLSFGLYQSATKSTAAVLPIDASGGPFTGGS